MSAMSSFSIEEILRTAREAGASDVHLAAGTPPRMRVNGVLETMNYSRITPSDTLDILISVMPEVQRQRFEERGEYDFSFAVPECGRCRANAYRQKGSVAFALHLVDAKVPSPEELGMPASVAGLYEKESGLVLVTGPSGSGRSATLACLVDQINGNRDALVITLEDPIEYMHSHKRAMVSQREMGLDSRCYADALRAALREDPDVILVGELRDLDTIETALTAAETGHLVFGTVHTGSAADAIDRIVGVFGTGQQQQIRLQLSQTLRAVLCQKLLPRTSGRGRVLACEVMKTDFAIRSLIREGKTHQIANVIQTTAGAGNILMERAVQNLFQAGIISRETYLRALPDGALADHAPPAASGEIFGLTKIRKNDIL